MSGVSVFLEAFHLLRPWALLMLAPILWLWWLRRKGSTRKLPQIEGIAPHLAHALTVGEAQKVRLVPVDYVALVLVLLTFAVSGPTWSRESNPFAAQSVPLVVVLQVTASMEEIDIAPSRLARAKQKVGDLLELRSGARTALVAFAGSAHTVVPMTEDPGVMQPYLEGLAPDVLPKEGFDIAAAQNVALQLLQSEGQVAVLYVLDGLSPSDASILANGAGSDAEGTSVSALPDMFLFLQPPGSALPAVTEGALALAVSADDRDVAQIERRLAAAHARAQIQDGDQPWKDRGLWFAWPAALLLLFWFRRGVAMRGFALFLAALVLQGEGAQAEGWRNWFLTPDQQGWRAYQSKDFARAAEVSEDPFLRGISQYKVGQYEAAADTLSRIDTAEAAFAEGMAHIKSRGYRDGVRAFERALTLDPEHADAKANLEVAEEIVAYVERVREQSDTGEDSGIGADDEVYDNEAGRGVETERAAPVEDAPQHLSTEQWMNTVDTRTGDFLRQRFRLEASQKTTKDSQQGGEN